MAKLLAFAMFALVAGVITVQVAAAAKPTGDSRPGWGYGDQNHIPHTGPPGQSVRPAK